MVADCALPVKQGGRNLYLLRTSSALDTATNQPDVNTPATCQLPVLLGVLACCALLNGLGADVAGGARRWSYVCLDWSAT